MKSHNQKLKGVLKMANCGEPPTGRVQTEGCSWEASSGGSLREDKGDRVGDSAKAGSGPRIRGADTAPG